MSDLASFESFFFWGFLILLILMERILPLRALAFFNIHRKWDFFLLGANEFLFPIIRNGLIVITGLSLNNWMKLSPIRVESSFRWSLLFIFFVFVLDGLNFLFHFLFHRLPVLWKGHQLHHSTKELTALSSFRMSWFEMVFHSLTIGMITGFFPVEAKLRVYSGLLFTFGCFFQHANIRITLPQWPKYIFILPQCHRWHHTKQNIFPYGQNFGFLFSIWDRIIGTYYSPNAEPLTYGFVQEEQFQKLPLWEKLIYPRPQRIKSCSKSSASFEF